MSSLWETFSTSLRLGLTSFGGPIAHLGYFERTYVEEKRWLTHEEYSHLVALCQLIPGPASSQINFLVGMRRSGWAGAISSWAGFALPSALLLYAFAVLAPKTQGPLLAAALHGLKLVAVAIVAQAVWGMANRLCPDRARTGIAVAGMALLLLFGGAFAQIAVIIVGAAAGVWLCRGVTTASGSQSSSISAKTAWIAFSVFVALLAGLPVLAALAPGGLPSMADIAYRAGALVFGGGHVVLPLLRDALVPSGMMTDDIFLAGYGMAQAVPGPLFTLAAYLGAAATPSGASPLVWGAAALVFIFLPGMLAAVAGVPVWRWLVSHPAAQGALAGINASVVGILGAALYDPVWSTAVLGKTDVVVAVTGFLLLEKWKVPPLLIVVFCVAASLASKLL
ncbi:MAG: chromate transporter [Elusimicrobia bacterium GWA2_62_23]|nr:MAG: chromate transporter [Elusimicrobia bacterium GWA2_62_23]OGR73482.1 MAG: chromate transporter [Elusimicrobia bacterium GWC2_63_65]